jgi:hypothetical protein
MMRQEIWIRLGHSGCSGDQENTRRLRQRTIELFCTKFCGWSGTVWKPEQLLTKIPLSIEGGLSMSKKKEVSGVALAEPVRTTAEEILFRRKQEAARKEADQRFYGETVLKMATDEASEADVEAATLVAEALGCDLQRDVDMVKKVRHFESQGFVDSQLPEFTEKHDQLFAVQESLSQKKRDAEAELRKIETELYAANMERQKFYSTGSGITEYRRKLAHVFACLPTDEIV